MGTDMVTECDGKCCQIDESTQTGEKADEVLANLSG